MLIKPDSVMVACRLYKRPLDIQMYTVDMFNKDSVFSHFQKVYDHGLVSLNRRPIRVFIHHNPPWSMLCPTDSTQKFYKAIGRDVLVTEAILFSLNATIVLNSDVAIQEPNYTYWFTIKEANNLEAMLLYNDVFSDTQITEFYAKYDYSEQSNLEFDSINLCSSASMADIDMTSTIMKIDNSNFRSQFEYLYPHGVECLFILVPSLRREKTFLFKVFSNNNNMCILITSTFLFL